MAEPNWAEMTDEQIATMSAPPEEGELEDNDSAADPAAEDESSEELDEEGNAPDVTGGADDDEDPETEDEESEDDLEPEDADSATQDPFDGVDSKPAEDDQSAEEQDEEDEDEDSEPEVSDFQAKYEEIMAPFKAAGREIKLDDPAQARRLMQMGVDYNLKMQTMKPYMKVLRTLEKAELLDQDRINFLIDLSQNKPEAIKKLLRDGSIDPMELDMEDNEAYSPTDHMVSESEMSVREAFQAIESTPTFNKTVQVLTKEWDSKSKAALADNPNLIGLMHVHIANGTYDEVWPEVMKRRLLGDLVGLSDLDAYNQTGQAMADSGQLSPLSPDNATSSAPNTTQAPAQGKGSPKAKRKRVAQKRAASPTKGGATGGRGKKVPNLADLSDEQIEKMSLSDLPI